MVVRGSALRRSLMDVVQGHAGVQRRGDEGMAQSVRPRALIDAGAASDPAHDAPGNLAVQPLAVGGHENRATSGSPMAGLPALAVRGSEGTVTTPPHLGSTVSVRWPLWTKSLDVGSEASDNLSPFRARSELVRLL
ncbi:MAG: hypothetical protein ABSA91_02745 [Acidimicrobiales bacterium]|jgi:hypothetical protein